MNENILPESRLTQSKSTKWINGSWWQPIFCANCGASGGFVPEENMTFAFYICNPCNEKYGNILNVYLMPDEIYFEKIKQEQLESYGRFLTPEEVAKVVNEDDGSALALLLKQH